MENQIYSILEQSGVPQQVHGQIAKSIMYLINTNVGGKLYVVDGINNELDEVESLEDAKELIKENFVVDGEIHPDIESVFVVKQIASVRVEDIEKRDLNGELVKYCKVIID